MAGVAGAGGFVVVLLVSVILLASAFVTLSPNRWGFDYSYNTHVVTENFLARGGRWFLGLGHGFLQLPAHSFMVAFTESPVVGLETNESCWFADGEPDDCKYGLGDSHETITNELVFRRARLSVRSKDGLNIGLEVAIRMKLGVGQQVTVNPNYPPEATRELQMSLERLWAMGGEDGWRQLVTVVAETEVRRACSKHSASDFYVARQAVVETLKQLLTSALASVEVTFEDIFMTYVAFPQKFQDAIQDTEIEQQKLERAIFEQQTAVIMAETSVKVAKVEVDESRYRAATEAAQFKAEKEIFANMIKFRIQEQGEAFALAKKIMGYEDNEALLTFTWLMALQTGEFSGLVMDTAVPQTLRVP